MTTAQIFAVTQSVLAILIVVGAGVLLALDTVEAELLMGIVGVVVGFFFGSAVTPVPFRQKPNGVDRPNERVSK